MISIDTNILLYAAITDSPFCQDAYDFLGDMGNRDDVVISELVLVELYTGLRNPAIMKNPLSAAQAVTVIQTYRSNPRWRITGYSDDSRALHDRLWKSAEKKDYRRRKIFDERLAFTLQRHGVTEFATVNEKDFEDAGFKKVFNPLVKKRSSKEPR